jgi:hypothetical protein
MERDGDSPATRDISALHSSEGVLDAGANGLMGAARSYLEAGTAALW